MKDEDEDDCEIEEFIFARNNLVFAVEMNVNVLDDNVRMCFGMYSGVISYISMKSQSK